MIVKTRNEIDVLEYPEIEHIYIEEINQDSIVLELGCGIPYALFDSQIKYNCKNLIGVDTLENEEKIISRYKELSGGEIYNGFNNLKEIHEAYVIDSKEIEGLTETQANRFINEYSNIYTIRTNYNITEKDLGELGKVDMIHLVDVLHFIPYKKCVTIIEQIPNLLNQNGIIIIRAHHEENESMINPTNSNKIGKRSYKSKYIDETVYLFDEIAFLNLVKILEQNGINRISEPEKHLNRNHISNSGYKSMVYIGRKK